MSESFDHLIDVSQAFLALVKDESRLLEENDLSKALELLPQKESLAQRHAEAIEVYTADDSWKKGPAERLEKLKEILDLLQEALLENQRIIAHVHSVRETIMQKVTQAICDQESPLYRYSKNKRPSALGGSVSLSVFNESI